MNHCFEIVFMYLLALIKQVLILVMKSFSFDYSERSNFLSFYQFTDMYYYVMYLYIRADLKMFGDMWDRG